MIKFFDILKIMPNFECCTSLKKALQKHSIHAKRYIFYMNHICINKKCTDNHLNFNNINKTASQSIFHYNKD